MYTLYKIQNIITNEYYIGVHKTNNPMDSYMGSGVRIQRQIKKYGKQNFIKTIIGVFETKELAYNNEQNILLEYLNDPLCLNLSSGGIGGSNFSGKKHSEETKEKLRQINLGKKHSEETRLKLIESNHKRVLNGYIPHSKGGFRGKTHSEETKEKIRQAAKKQHDLRRMVGLVS